MFLLRLNPMTANAERNNVVARAETVEALIAFVESERVEFYRDGGYGKCFRQGGPLEWYNPPDDNPWYPCFHDIGTLDEAIQDTVKSWNEMLSRIRDVTVTT